MDKNKEILLFIEDLLEEMAEDKSSIIHEFSGNFEHSFICLEKELQKKRTKAREVLGISEDFDKWTYTDYCWSFKDNA